LKSTNIAAMFNRGFVCYQQLRKRKKQSHSKNSKEMNYYHLHLAGILLRKPATVFLYACLRFPQFLEPDRYIERSEGDVV